MKKIKNILYGQDKKEEVKYLPNYKKYDKFGFLKELKEMLNLKETIPIKKEEKKTDEQISLEELTKNYAFTADNFVKMILILIRIRANIPVILMGETGCGKTSLIKKLYEILNYGSNSKLRILNIHAGTNDEDIIKFIDEINNEANILYIANNKDREFAKKEGMIYEEEKIWVFLDEINTCKSMGLISELMCKHSCQGKKLKENIVFIAACNPYRKAKRNNQNNVGLHINQVNLENKKLSEKEKINIEKSKFLNSNHLVYTVNPLPHSLLHFVVDFGSLKSDDEEKYIETMIEDSMNKIFNLNEEKLGKEKLTIIKNQAKEMIITAQNFIRNNNDISSVSLREIRRFIIFYEFFYSYLKNKKKNLLHLIKEQMEEKEK